MGRRLAAWLLPAVAFAVAAAEGASADPVTTPNSEGVREQSCKALAASTVGVPEDTSSGQDTGALGALPAAPRGLLPPRVYLRTRKDTFNRGYAFATRRGTIYAQKRVGGDCS